MMRKKRTIRMIVLGEMIVLLAIAGALSFMASTLSAENATDVNGRPAASAGPDSATRLR